MREVVLYTLTLVLLLWVTASILYADVESKMEKILAMPGRVVDMAASADGRRTFVLLEKGKVAVVDAQDHIESMLETGVAADRLELSQDGSKLLLNDRNENRLNIFALDVIHDVASADSPFKGAADAPVTIVQFSEFQCPHCSQVGSLLDQVLERYPTQVKIVFRNYPLRSHPYARHAALAGLAAHLQGKFWSFHDLLFANQQNLNPQLIATLAVQAGLDPARYQQDLQSETLAALLDYDIQVAQDAGVRGTPTFFVNGRLLRERNLGAFSLAIEQELRRMAR